MSKIGKKPVLLKEGVTAEVKGDTILIKGTKGEFLYKIPSGISVNVADNAVTVSQKEGIEETSKALFGLIRATIANMAKGVSEGFLKKLEMTGVGYRAQLAGRDLSISVGFSHPVKITAPSGITFGVVENAITVSGIDKMQVGDIAASIRRVRPPEPYKGKGIKYFGEHIRRKAGKAAKAVGTK